MIQCSAGLQYVIVHPALREWNPAGATVQRTAQRCSAMVTSGHTTEPLLMHLVGAAFWELPLPAKGSVRMLTPVTRCCMPLLAQTQPLCDPGLQHGQNSAPMYS